MDVGLLISHRNDGATKVIMVEWRCLSAKSQKAIITITTAKVRGVANAGLTHGRGHSVEMVNRAKQRGSEQWWCLTFTRKGQD